MSSYFPIALVAFYPTFIIYYALNRYTLLWRNLSSWGLMETFLSYTGLVYAVILMLLFVPWMKLTKKVLRRKYSFLTSLFAGVLFGVVLSLFVALFASRVPGREIETSILFYLPLATYGAVFGGGAFMKEARSTRKDSVPQ